jgi:hypothetical protein
MNAWLLTHEHGFKQKTRNPIVGHTLLDLHEFRAFRSSAAFQDRQYHLLLLLCGNLLLSCSHSLHRPIKDAILPLSLRFLSAFSPVPDFPRDNSAPFFAILSIRISNLALCPALLDILLWGDRLTMREVYNAA